MRKYLTAALAGLAVVAGCGHSEKDAIDQPGKKILYAPIRAKVTALDPLVTTDVYSAIVSGQCYEGLYQYHFLKGPKVIIPCLAESMPQVSADHLTYTIKLRNDVYYIDDKCFPGGTGRQVRAEDFVYELKRVANVKNLSPNWPSMAKRIVGLDEFRKYTEGVKKKEDVDYSRPIEGLKAVDNFTLQVKLVKPWPQVLYGLMGFTPMAKEAVDYYGDQMINKAIGTGPFMIKSYQPGSKIELVRNPKFRKEFYPTEGDPGAREKGWLADAGKALPLLDGIVFFVIEEDQPYWLSLMQAKIDAGGVPKDFFNQAITVDRKLTPEMIRKGFELILGVDPDIGWIGYNMEDPILGKNLPLRRALSVGFSRKEFIDLFFSGLGIPAKGIFPPNVNPYDANLKNPWADYNPALAKILMREAEKINKGKITLTLAMPGTDTLSRQIAEYIRRNFEKIGVTLKIDYTDWPTYLDHLNKKQVQLFLSGVVFTDPDGIGSLMLFYGPYESPGSNHFNFKDKAYDELFRKVEVMDESPERTRLYRQMERMVCEACPAVFTEHRIRATPYYKYLKNFKSNPFNLSPLMDAKYVDIDLGLRKKLIGR